MMAAAIATACPGPAPAATFGDDVAFLRKHTDVIVLKDDSGTAQIAVVPAWQARVMTSTSGGDGGYSHGWINRELIASGKLQPHINVFGGEDRFWMGPEGGQFSIFFASGSKFEFADWFTPAPLDTEPFRTLSISGTRAVFGARFMLTNYSGTRFDVAVERQIELLDPAAAWRALGVSPGRDVRLVAYETDNRITNAGDKPWRKETGLLSIWILGMFNPSSAATIVVPIHSGSDSRLGVKVTSDYFGAIPGERLVVADDAVFLSADGKYRSKIGVGPKRSKGVLGSYDADQNTLTIVQFTQPGGLAEYVNSLWKLQDDPYAGDAANAYNDGPVQPGAKPLGPFYELESSSPAAALTPGRTLEHVHRTIHLHGSRSSLDGVARTALGVSLDRITNALPRAGRQ